MIRFRSRLPSRAYLVNLLLGAGVLCGAGAPPPSQVTDPPRLTATLGGPYEVVFDWRKDRCDQQDTADAPARAFRAASGTAHLESSHDIWRESSGPTLGSVSHKCNVLFKSSHDNLPSRLADYEWLGATYTVDGEHIDLIVHNEYHARSRTDICPSQIYLRCWANTLTYAYSDDGGRTFQRPSAPGNFIAGLPYQYTHDVGFPVGYFQPSNIMEHNGYYYLLFTATAYQEQRAGTCIMRTNNLRDPSSWRAWDGADFSIRFVNPYAAPVGDPTRHLCKPLSRRLGIMGGAIFDPKTSAFILATQGGAPKVGGGTSIGIVAQASYDLINWSQPVLLWSDPSAARSVTDNTITDIDASLLDPSSPSRNFDTINDGPYVYFVRRDLQDPPYGRKLMRVPVQFRVEPPP